MKKLLLVFASILALGIGSSNAAFIPGTTDNSLSTLNNGQLSAGGLINVLSLACGIPINDGATHTVSTAPAGSCFNGKTTLAGLAAISINGATPFSFLTAAGATIGPLCQTGGTVNCFTNGVYTLTDASVANMDIAWLAIQGALITGKVKIPAGKYVVGSTNNLPLMIPQNAEGTGATDVVPIMVTGEGANTTFIKMGHDFGALNGDATLGNPLMSCGDPSANASNTKGRYTASETMCAGDLENLTLVGPTTNYFFAMGAISVLADGLALAGRLRTLDVHSEGFYNDISMVGSHTEHIRLHALGGVRGFYFAAGNGDVGDLMFVDFNSSGMSQASIAVNGGSSVTATFDGETYLGGPYAFFGENNGCSDIINGSQFHNLMTEFVGNAIIHDDHVYSGGQGAASTGTYIDGNKCRGVEMMRVDHFYSNYVAGDFWGQSGGRRRRASFDVAAMSAVEFYGIAPTGGQFAPVADPIGSAGIGIFDINSIGSGLYEGLLLSGDVSNLFGQSSNSIPVFFGNPTSGYGTHMVGAAWEQPGIGGGIFAQFVSQGTYTSTVVGDVFEQVQGGSNTISPAGLTLTQPVAGVVQVAGMTNGIVMPIQTYGVTFVNLGYAFPTGIWQKNTGISRLTFVAGTGGTNGTYINITATGGGCTTEPVVTATVAGGVMTAVTATNTGAGCTSRPTFSTSTITGLTGGSITATWPAANAIATANMQTGAIVGYGFGGGSGSGPLGTNGQYGQLLGLR